jgi:hypothetical protein
VDTHVPDDADDLEPGAARRTIGRSQTHAPADWVDRTKGALRKRRVDDDGVGSLYEIARVEAASGDERLLQLVEEVDGHSRRADLEWTGHLRRNGVKGVINLHHASEMIHPRQHGRERDRAHVWLFTEPFDERGLCSGDLLRLRGSHVERNR